MVITVLATPLITRIYTPIDYEVWLTWFSGVLIVVSIGTLCYENAIVLPKCNKEAMVICQACILISLLMSLLGPIIYLITIKFGIQPLNSANIYLLSSITYITAVCYCMSNSFIAYLTRFENYYTYALIQSSLPILNVTLQLIIGQFEPTSISLFLSTITAQVVALILSIFFVLRNGREILTEILISSTSLRLLAKYRNYPKFTTPYNLLGVLRERLIYFVLAGQENGFSALYGISFRLINLPNTLFAEALRPFMFQQLHKNGFKKMLFIPFPFCKNLIVLRHNIIRLQHNQSHHITTQ